MGRCSPLLNAEIGANTSSDLLFCCSDIVALVLDETRLAPMLLGLASGNTFLDIGGQSTTGRSALSVLILPMLPSSIL